MHNVGKQDEMAGTGERAAGLSRRRLIQISTGGAVMAAMGVGKLMAQAPAGGAAAPAASSEPLKLKGNIKQGVSLWSAGMPLEELCKQCNRLGLKGVDLVGVKDYPTLKKYNLVSSMSNSYGLNIPKGFNRTENHETCITAIKKNIDDCVANGYPNVICFSGNRAGMSDEDGAKNCIEGLKKVAGYAEKNKILVCMEYLNTKNHADYMCSNSAWAFKVLKAVGSPNVKLLYDIYHAAMMDENIMKDIEENIDFIGHFHTAGKPGRNDINDTQTIKYPEIMKLIAAKKFTGFVSHEFNPKKKGVPAAIAALEEAVKICDV
ncbi:MAG: sugar phosphate isomerase/epimerase [Candidatus Sumerlaeota bacterium]|nr:sugar phosphate isomerase/epimerase [Candidatus Sumerlaeota bacterium]